jgi:signal transduction histidine kinase
VISTPPFGLKITNERGELEFADHYVIRRGMDMVVDGGLVACVVPLSFLSRKDTEDIRKTMVDNKWLEAIVYLPENIFAFSKIRTAILFIRKEKHNRVIFADGTTSVYKRNKVNIIDDELIANLLVKAEYNPEFAIFDSGFRMVDELPLSLYKKLRSDVFFDRIQENDYNLAPGDYFTDIIPKIEGFHHLQLKRLVKSTAKTASEKGEGKIIKPSMLSSDPFTPLTEEGLELGGYDKPYNIISEDALLVSAFSNLRPTLFRYNGGKVAYRRDLLHAIYIDSNKILPEYLLLELTKGYVADQLRLKYKGDAISRLSLDDFLSIYIQVPNFKSQEKEIYEDQKILHFAKIEKELSVLKDKQHDDYVKMLRQRKHRIQQVMNEFAPAFSLLDKCREKNGGILRDDDIVAARTGETVSSYFNKLHHILNKVENLVTFLVDKEHWESPTIINIDSFVDNIPQHHLSDKFDIQTLHDHDIYIEEEGETVDLNNDRFININEDDLAIIFDNIIANASKWGFTDSIRRDYRIRIDVSDTSIDGKSAVRICISNNGNPIHQSVDRKRLFEWGYGSGTGIGTWQLKDIVEHYGGTIKLNENPEETSGFVTEYEIILPLAYEE